MLALLNRKAVMNPIIDIEDVSFSYRETREPALNHISLAIGEGDFLGIIGPSGAGKSTLAACLSGAIPHHFGGTLYGAVHVAGKDTCEVTLTDISRIVGSVLQDIDTQMVASVVEDELLFGMENFGVPHDEIEQRLSDALQTVGIADLRDREIATLSAKSKRSPSPQSWRCSLAYSCSTSPLPLSTRQVRCSFSIRSQKSTANKT